MSCLNRYLEEKIDFERIIQVFHDHMMEIKRLMRDKEAWKFIQGRTHPQYAIGSQYIIRSGPFKKVLKNPWDQDVTADPWVARVRHDLVTKQQLFL